MYFFFVANPKLQDHDVQVLVFDVRAIESHERIFSQILTAFGRVSSFYLKFV